MSVDSKRISAAPWSRANWICEDPRCNIVQREIINYELETWLATQKVTNGGKQST